MGYVVRLPMGEELIPFMWYDFVIKLRIVKTKVIEVK